jgi:UDP-glucose 4-epimerase
VERPFQSHVTNVEGTATVLDHCARFGKRVVVASSSEVYGDHPGTQELVETAQRIYGPTTRLRDRAALQHGGPASEREIRQRDPDLRLQRPRPPTARGAWDGTQVRCVCHVADAVRALKGLMPAGRAAGEVFNVGSNRPIRILDLAERVRELTSSSSEIVFVPYDEVYGVGIEDMQHRAPAIAKIQEATGWRPRFDLDRILQDVVDYVQSRNSERRDGSAVALTEEAAESA